MVEPVDLTNLREITGGDIGVERELFREFISSTEKHLEILSDNCSDGANEEWRKSAHAIKGSAINLGAARLSGLCKIAQEKYNSGTKEKEAMLGSIKLEYGLVKEYLNNMNL